MVSIEGVIFYLVLLDSLFANIATYCCAKWYKKNFKGLSKWFPMVKGWSLLYLVLVLWVGYGLYRLGLL
ncbi:hypothetical protein CMI42_00295 [Candidatus Pacearchaeota archaeon]|nr:hypothetical protein [Candidatus Pacearchaeota archaeon]